jgi:predicted patatin/cPLA2 family phospholipase
MVFLQKTMEISTQSMDQLRRVLFRDVETVRIHARYTQPEMATDMLEVNIAKLGLLWQRGRDCARDAEADLRKFLT